MKNAWMLLPVGLVMAMGCTSARDVSVTGDAKPQGTTSIEGPITLEFFEVPSTNDSALGAALKTTTLQKPGPFSETVSVEGDKVRIFALADTNKNGKCDAGEPWAQVDAAITNDKVDNASLVLGPSPCPPSAPGN
jgi:hypothetical protein